MLENVNEELIKEGEKLENSPRLILALIDLLFMEEDKEKVLPS